MKKEFQLLHQGLLNDIEKCMQLNTPCSEKVEACFWIAYTYWNRLKDRVELHGLINDREEIQFFRDVKPRFTFYLEYYAILSEVLQFVPKDRGEAITFWRREDERFLRFCNKNRQFIQYYESGNNEMDAIYFKKVNGEFKSSHDHLISSLLAQKMYKKYVKEKVRALKSTTEYNTDAG